MANPFPRTPATLDGLERTVEAITGVKVANLRRATLSENRVRIEDAHRAPLAFTSRFPFIGRGNVMRDRLITSRDVEREFASAFR